jgi:hypothetical protein
MEKRGISIIGMILRLAVLMGLTFAAANARASEVEPWKERRNAIIVDAYELNSIDWEAMLKDKRIAGFIAKASDGLPESYTCTGDHGGDTVCPLQDDVAQICGQPRTLSDAPDARALAWSALGRLSSGKAWQPPSIRRTTSSTMPIRATTS